MRTWLALLCLLPSLFLPCSATDVPVFRFALERWDPAPHAVEITLAEADRQALTADFAAFSMVYAPEFTATGAAESRIRVRLPHGVEWFEGPWSKGLAGRLANSPRRVELVADLIRGASLVWILVESGDRAADDALVARLRKRLDYLAGVLELPVPQENSFRSQRRLELPNIPIRIDLKIMRISRQETAEADFIRQLAAIGVQPQTPAFVVPVFGRGRALERFRPVDLTDPAIDEASQFILGACSCQVKDLNPGEDLLIGVDWYERLFAQNEAGSATEAIIAATATGQADLMAMTETVYIGAGSGSAAAGPATPASAPVMTQAIWIIVGGLIAGGVLLTILASRRKP